MRLGKNHPPVEALNLVALMYKHQEGVVKHGHIVAVSLLR